MKVKAVTGRTYKTLQNTKVCDICIFSIDMIRGIKVKNDKILKTTKTLTDLLP